VCVEHSYYNSVCVSVCVSVLVYLLYVEISQVCVLSVYADKLSPRRNRVLSHMTERNAPFMALVTTTSPPDPVC
jgi:hypothetical protein